MEKLIGRFIRRAISRKYLDNIDLYDVDNPEFIDKVIEIDSIKFWKLKFETLFHESVEYDKEESHFIQLHKMINGTLIKPKGDFAIANGLLVAVATHRNIINPDFGDKIMKYARNMRISLNEDRASEIISQIDYLTRKLIFELSRILANSPNDELEYLAFSQGKVRSLALNLLNYELQYKASERLNYIINS